MFFASPPGTQQTANGQATLTVVSRDATDDAGEPITYIATPNPEVTSAILSLPPRLHAGQNKVASRHQHG